MCLCLCKYAGAGGEVTHNKVSNLIVCVSAAAAD